MSPRIPDLRLGALLIPITMIIAFAVARPASALTLEDLANGGSFMAGGLLYDDFQVVISGDLDPDLGAYDVTVLPDGFCIMGPLSVEGGNAFGDLLIQYDVWAKDGSPPIASAVLAFDAIAVGPDSLASVSEDYLSGGPAPLASLLVFATPGLSRPSDEAFFEPTVTHLRVIKDVILLSGPDGSASIRAVYQRYPVPAPAASGLLGLGLAGLWAFGRVRDRRA
jgi:hypothetical protein